MRETELVIIGGGSAGIAAAVSAYENGCRDILILERDRELGGILLQCIHNGFGLQIFGEELAGPSYAEKWTEKLLQTGVRYLTDTMVTHLHEDKTIEYVNTAEGYVTLRAKAVILAMGCRERTRGAIAVPGLRPAGIWSAGTAQRYLNMEGYLVGRRVFILGSGDIGLIMARRMTLEGAEVLGVAEIMPYPGGLPRNRKQCLEDFNIPLYLSHTVTDIRRKDRLEGITVMQVDDARTPVPGTEKDFEVDTLLLSVGLIPENSLSEEAHIVLHPVTGGPVVNECYETSVPGIFACGNVLHVHDLVDYVSEEGRRAGRFVSSYLRNEVDYGREAVVCTGEGISYVVPQFIRRGTPEDKTEFLFRVNRSFRNVVVCVYRDGVLLREWKKQVMAPAEMEKLVLKREELAAVTGELKFMVREGDGNG